MGAADSLLFLVCPSAEYRLLICHHRDMFFFQSMLLMSFVQLIDPRNLHRLLIIFLWKVLDISIMVYSTSLSSSQLPWLVRLLWMVPLFVSGLPRRRSFSMPQSITLMHKQSNQARCIVFTAITLTENPAPNLPTEKRQPPVFLTFACLS